MSDVSERSRLLRRLEQDPGDVDARRSLARLYVDSGQRRKAADELARVARAHLERGEGDEAHRTARFALALDSENIELRLLLVQVHASFPEVSDARAAEPIVEIVEIGLEDAEEVVDLEGGELDDVLDVEEIEVLEREEITRPPLPAAARTDGRGKPPAPEAPSGDTAAEFADRSEPSEGASERAAFDVHPADTAQSPAARSVSTRGASDISSDFVELEELVDAVSALMEGEGTVPASPSTVPARPVDAVTESPDRLRPTAERVPVPRSSRGITAGGTQSGAQRLAQRRRSPNTSPRPTEHRRVLGMAREHADLEDVPPNRLFSRLSLGSRTQFFAACELVEYDAGAVIVAAGDRVGRLLLVCVGVVDVAGTAAVRAGFFLAGFEFRTQEVSRADAVARSRVVVLEMDRSVCETLAADGPIRDALDATMREQLVEQALETAPLFANLPPQRRAELAGKFFPVAVSAGERLVEKGAIHRRLLLLHEGTLVVDGRGGRRDARRQVEPGDFFGYVSAVLGRPAQVTVVARGAATVMVLPEQELYRLVAAERSIARAARDEVVARGDETLSVERIAGLGGYLRK